MSHHYNLVRTWQVEAHTQDEGVDFRLSAPSCFDFRFTFETRTQLEAFCSALLAVPSFETREQRLERKAQALLDALGRTPVFYGQGNHQALDSAIGAAGELREELKK